MLVRTADIIYAMRLRDLLERISICRERYWEIPKDERIIAGLRPQLNEHSYSGTRIVEMCIDLITKALIGAYPFQSDSLQAFLFFGQEKNFDSAKEVTAIVEPLIAELERRLDFFASNASAP
jgi:hypothetical protein